MTLAKLCEEYQVELCLFDGSNWHSSGFYNPDTNVLAIDHNDPSSRKRRARKLRRPHRV